MACWQSVVSLVVLVYICSDWIGFCLIEGVRFGKSPLGM